MSGNVAAAPSPALPLRKGGSNRRTVMHFGKARSSQHSLTSLRLPSMDGTFDSSVERGIESGSSIRPPVQRALVEVGT